MARDNDPWRLPDGVELNEEFIRGGVHEPPARTRESIARYGGQRTSWRHGGAPIGAPASEPAMLEQGPRPGRVGKAIAIIGAAAVLIALAATYLHKPGRDHSSALPNLIVAGAVQPRGTIVPTAPGSAGPAPSDSNAVRGISPSDPIGTCYRSAQPIRVIPGRAELNLAATSCQQQHSYELASYEAAAGSDTAYPNTDYWQHAVAQTCYQDLLAYTRKSRAQWPATLRSDNFVPTVAGWQTGDRTVYCVAFSSQPVVGSVKGRA